MRYYFQKCIFAVFLLVLLLNAPSAAQWTQLSGLGGGRVISIASHGSNILLGTPTLGVFRSTDAGISWFQSNQGLTDTYIMALHSTGNTLFASTSSGIFRSMDNGNSWVQIGSSLPYNGINVFHSKGLTVFVGSNCFKGMYISTNNGNNWTYDTVINDYIRSYINLGTNIFAGTGNSGVYKSTNNGQTWIQTNSGLTNLRIQGLTVIGSDLYAGTFYDSNKILYRSTNLGNSWTNISNGNYIYIDYLMSFGNNLLAANHSDGIYVSSNNGANWTSVSSNARDANFYGIAVLDSLLFCAYNGAGVYKSLNGGFNWSPVYGYNHSTVTSLISSGNDIFAGTVNGVFKSTDFGENWNLIKHELGNDVTSLYVSGNNIYETSAGSGLSLSTDNGLSWSARNNGLMFPIVNSVALIGPYLLAASDPGVYRSLDNGITWNLGYLYLDHSPDNLYSFGDYVFATMYNGIYKSSNNGLNWIKVISSGGAVMSKSGNRIYFVNSSGVLYLSTNNGDNWNSISNILANAILANGSNIFVGSISNLGTGISVSTDYGYHWIQKNEGFASMPTINCFVISGNYIFAGTGDCSVWRRELSEILDVQNFSSEIPTEYKLYQNYPNPFNPVTTIKFDIPKSSNVSLKVYDITGRIVSTLLNGTEQAGSYSVNFDAGYLSSGIYFYRLVTNAGVFTKKMVIQK